MPVTTGFYLVLKLPSENESSYDLTLNFLRTMLFFPNPESIWQLSFRLGQRYLHIYQISREIKNRKFWRDQDKYVNMIWHHLSLNNFHTFVLT